MEIKVTKTTQPKEIPTKDLGFGKNFTDHMFIADYSRDKGWYNARIVPFGNLSMHPAATVFHYGAEIFEGMKAYRRADGKIQLFQNDPFTIADGKVTDFNHRIFFRFHNLPPDKREKQRHHRIRNHYQKNRCHHRLRCRPSDTLRVTAGSKTVIASG